MGKVVFRVLRVAAAAAVLVFYALVLPGYHMGVEWGAVAISAVLFPVAFTVQLVTYKCAPENLKTLPANISVLLCVLTVLGYLLAIWDYHTLDGWAIIAVYFLLMGAYWVFPMLGCELALGVCLAAGLVRRKRIGGN